MIVVDTSGLYALVNKHDEARNAIERILEADPGPFILSPFVLAELDYLIATRADQQREITVLREVTAGAYDIAHFDSDDLDAAIDVIERYGDLGIGLTDASLVVLADRHDTNRVLTLDERHFRALRTPAGKPFTILPADA